MLQYSVCGAYRHRFTFGGVRLAGRYTEISSGPDEEADDKKLTAYYEYVAHDTGAFRLVFESDLTNEPAVREQVDRVTTECARLIAGVIHDDTGLPDEASRLLAVSLVGMAQVSARFWLTEAGGLGRDQAAALVAGLAWRGIGGYPRTDDPSVEH